MRGRLPVLVDVGSSAWWERLEQPLTHPYVLRRNYPLDMPWTDDMEAEANRPAVPNRDGPDAALPDSNLPGVSGAGRGRFRAARPLLRVFQQILRQALA